MSEKFEPKPDFMEKKGSIIFFGDGSLPLHPALSQTLQRQTQGSLLSRFFEGARKVMQEEISRSSSTIFHQVPSLLDLHDLTRKDGSGLDHQALAPAMLLLIQLGQFISWYEERPEEPYPDPSRSIVVGLCVGELSAIAVSVARSLTELIPLAQHSIRIAVRMGFAALTVRDDLETPEDPGAKWAISLSRETGLTDDSALDEVHSGKGILSRKRAYISASFNKALTIQGPPSTLQHIGDWLDKHRPEIPKRARQLLPIYTLYHAPHLYPEANIERIMGSECSANNSYDDKPWSNEQARLVSPVTGTFYQSRSRFELLKQVLFDVLTKPILWENVLGCFSSHVKTSGYSECTIRPFGPTYAARSLASTLEKETAVRIVYDNSFASSNPSQGTRTQREPIAIIGMGGRFPGAANHDELWKLLEQGLDTHKVIPLDRFDPEIYARSDGGARNPSGSSFGCFMDSPGMFDARFFNMSPREALQTDPQQRLALVTAYEALEMSGFVPDRTPSTQLERIGTFYGQTADDYREINASQDISTYYISGNDRAFGPGRVNYFFKFGGPSMSVDTACSSSAVALNLACNSIWSNECDTALAGGMMLLTSPDTFCGLSKGHFLSTTGQCKTFDDKADGYCRGEAVASVVVKRLSAAQADNDKILGLILSAGTNYSAKSVSITHPHSATQETLYKRLLAEAGLDPFDVDYVEMHGTGTQAGDAAEMASVSNVFAPSSTPRPRQHPLYLGSAKANLGHGESVSGVTALMKIMLVLREQQIPPHIGIKSGTINHSFPGLDERNIRIAMGSTDFPCQQSRRRRVLLNNFGAAGGNTALLLEEAPLTKAGASHDPRCDHIVTISAKRPESLRKNIENMIEYLDKQPEVSLSDLSYTTTARRIQHSYRVAVVASSISDLRDRLSVALQSHEYKPHAKSPRVALVFTGQGSFHIPLAKTLYETCTQFREDVQRFDNLSRDHGFLSMLGAVDGTISEANDLCATQTQLALTTVQMALYRLYATWGVKHTVVVGHSLGEYAALYASGVLSASDALYLVGRRATLLEASCTRGTHSMLAVNASAETLRKMLGERFNLLEITCRNGPVDIVLGGPDSQVKDIKEYLDSQGVQCTILAIPYAFHSSQVEPLLDSFEEAAAGVVYCDPTCPLASPLLGSVIRDSGIIGPEYLRRHARETVDFHKAVEAIDKEDLCDKDTVWLELGPSAVCLKMIKSILGPQSEGACVLKAREDPWTTACRALSLLYTRGLALSWSEYHRDFEAGQQLLHLPSYAFEETNYYIEYKGDWALRKGDDLANAPTTLSVPARSGPGTSSVQRLISRDIVGGKSVMVFETDLSDPALHHMIAGHVMNGVALCPAGVFADMALTIGEFVTRDKCSSVPPSGINVTDMEIVKGLVVPALRPDQPQLVRLEATTDFERGSVHVVISELSHDRKSAGCNVKCVVRYGEHHTWLKEWARTAYLISKRIEHLELDAKAGSTARLPRSLVYKLFSTVVNYSQGYQGIYEALINVEELEAAATIHFQQDRHGGEFTNSPIWIDNLAQLSGFLMNATGITNSLKEVFIAQGWESFQIAQEIDPAKEYRVHLKMRDLTRGLYVGDTSILQDGQMVGLIGGIKFQKLSRRTMDAVLKVSPSDSHQSTRHSPSESPNVMQPRTKALSEHVQANVPDSKVWVNTTKDEAFAIFAQEVGMSIAELSDTTSLSDLGVDSLLSLTILAKLRERLGIDVPQSAFQDCESVRDLRQLISTCTSQETALHDNNEDTSSSESSKIYTPPARGTPGKAESVTIDLNTVYTVIADQIGVSVTELLAANDFEALGVDSLMSLSILGSLRESLGLDVQPDMMQGTFSLDTIKSEFERCFPSKQPVNLSSAEDVTHPTLKAKSVLLQGNAKSADKTLFLFPDGSGSASSYINLPNIPEDICVFGIDSPFLRRADEYTCTLEEASRIMLNEVRRRQPTGPYLLAGWSAGGMYAYEAARLLIASGEKVEKLILIDSPCRLLHGAMPQDVLDFVSQSGVITAKNNGAAPEWLIKHFSATIEAVKRYSPQAIESSVAPDTFLIWASEGVFEDFGKTTKIDLSDSVATWLLQPKPSPGSQGWDRLLCPERVWSTSVSGNHFSMVHPPECESLVQAIRDAVANEVGVNGVDWVKGV